MGAERRFAVESWTSKGTPGFSGSGFKTGLYRDPDEKLEGLRSADYKAPGGKLVRVRLKEEQGQIRSVKITGDFFLVPEESLGKLEKMLEDAPLRESELRLLVGRFFRGTGAQGLGVSSDDFVKAILSAKETI
jgi:hypothetical protein